jgi:hypothetical protein
MRGRFRRIMKTFTAMERFSLIAGERGVVLGELLDHALDALRAEA